MLEDIKNSLDNIVGFMQGIDSAFNNPVGELSKFFYNFFKDCLETFSLASYEILVIVGFFALVLYVFGWKKGKSVAWMCPAIYMIVQILTKCLVK